jgi:hypothetical protein
MFTGYDQISRLRLAATDMGLVAHAAAGLIDAHAHHGPARVFQRVIETGMVVIYARPFLASNDARLGDRWRPEDEASRTLHRKLLDLRDEYYAHAEHTPHRMLEVMHGVSPSGRPILTEAYTHLPVETLTSLREIARDQEGRFRSEADRLDLELFGPRDPR